jgi:hypothetical protein
VTTPTGTAGSGLAPDADARVWHTLGAGLVLAAEEADERAGLSSAEVAATRRRTAAGALPAGQESPPGG